MTSVPCPVHDDPSLASYIGPTAAAGRMPDAAAMDAIAAILPEISPNGPQGPLRRRVAAIVRSTGRTIAGDP